jgi:hypothetical protein
MRNANKRNGPNRSRPFSAHRSAEQVVADLWPLTPGTYLRRGLSLLEVLISFFILLVGVVMVITLFPIGVLNVREAVKDTRSTITALEAQALVLGMGWPDDPYLLRPPHRGFAGGPGYGPSPSATGQSPNGGDPRGIDPATTPPFAGTRPANDIYGTAPDLVFAPNVNNVYAMIPNADGTVPPFPQDWTSPQPPNGPVAQRFHPMAGEGIGFPIYIDPQLANASSFQFSGTATPTPTDPPLYKRIPIRASQPLGGTNYTAMPPFENTLNDLVIHSLSEVQYQPAGAAGGVLASPSRRDQFIRQHFYVQDELHTESNLPSAPYNPNRFQGTALPGWRYVKSADSASPDTPTTLQPPGFNSASASANQVFNTASRNDAYTWAFVVRNRKLQAQPANGPPQPNGAPSPPGFNSAGGPDGKPYLVPKPNDYSNDNISVLVYHKRATGKCYQLVRGCLFNGSATMTLCWDPTITTEAPAIRRGSWLMETTLSPGLRDNTPGTPAGPAPLPPAAGGFVKYRHAIEFYRVASVQEPVLSQTDGQMYQVVNLEQPVTTYPITHALGDGRALPDLYEPYTFSGNAYPIVIDGTGAVNSTLVGGGTAAVNSVWVPIVVMHGLQEVFSVRN